MKNSLESLRAEAERQKARAEGLAEQVAALTKESNRQSARIMELNGIIKHIRLVEAGKRGALAKQLHQLIAEHQDLQLEMERVMNEGEIAKNERDYLRDMCDDFNNQYKRKVKECEEWEIRLRRCDKWLFNLMRRNLWQRIINKPVAISGKTETTERETETTEGHEPKPEVPTIAEQ